MAEKKMTKVEAFGFIAEKLDALGETELAEYARKEVAALVAKAAKAKERAEAKKAEADALEAAVASALTDEFQTGDAVFAAVDGDDEDWATLGKVRNRLSKLVKAGVAVKEQVEVKDGEKTRKVMGYKLA